MIDEKLQNSSDHPPDENLKIFKKMIITLTLLLEWIAAIFIGLFGVVILLPRIFLRRRMSVPLFPLQRRNQSGRLEVGYREIANDERVVSVFYPCERTGSRTGQVISTIVNVGKINDAVVIFSGSPRPIIYFSNNLFFHVLH